MASLYAKPKSPYWYIQFINKDGRRENRSTGFRRDLPKDTASARILLAEMAEKELTRRELNRQGEASDDWGFVQKFLVDHFRIPITLARQRTRWEWVSLYLAERKLRSPETIRFGHGQDYIDWRTAYKKKTGKVACRNTAIAEMKLFSMILQRAVQLGICRSNPLTRLGIKKDDPDEKPEITDEEFKTLLSALESEPVWMRHAFLIAMHTGCRLRETIIPASAIDLANDTLTFETPKGGRKRAFSIPIPPALLPLFKEMLHQRRQQTLTMPFQPSRQFQHFFRRAGMDHLCFHCLRVTFITRLARAGVPLSEAMRRVNHASTLIHRVYQRLSVADLRARPLALFSAISGQEEQTGNGSTPRTDAGKRAHQQRETRPSGTTSAARRSRPPARPRAA